MARQPRDVVAVYARERRKRKGVEQRSELMRRE
jgi:hypothetical protein